VKNHFRGAACAFAFAALALSGCAKKNDTTEAIKAGVVRDISKSFNMSNMDVIVDSVSFRDKEADATVTFTLKGGTRDQGMSMKYLMERHDDGEWYIKSRSSPTGGMGAPGASGSLPAGHPEVSGAPQSGSTPLPPGHPALGK
jgi:hypothetical protein